MMQPDLFAGAREPVALGPGAVLLGGFALDCAAELVAAVEPLSRISPFRHMATRGGKRLSVAMFNCGEAGWISDRSGYRYDAVDPLTGRPWPPMPAVFRALAARAARAGGHADFRPDACLVNRYVAGTRLSLHRDMDERDGSAPIVSVSLGLPATFLWGGAERSDRPSRYPLVHGDAVVWGGPSRMTFHGIAPLKAGDHPLTGGIRYNLTFRKAL